MLGLTGPSARFDSEAQIVATPITILIVDDHAVVRQGISTFLKLDPGFRVVGEARDGSEAIRRARETRPDVVLMDLMMPQVDGLQATAAIRKELPDTEVIILTSFLVDGIVRQAMQAGAMSFLLKEAEADELLHAIRAAAAGQVQLSPQAAARLVQECKVANTSPTLSQRELDVLRLLASGQSNKEIAKSLTISETTVKAHVRSILSKLEVSSRVQATLHAIRHGLV
jgi:DNA-binding NarL/FixJ family response regulator